MNAENTKTKDVLQEWFEPASKKELYWVELQGILSAERSIDRRFGRRTYGKKLIRIEKKAYSDLPVEAQKWLALNQFLA